MSLAAFKRNIKIRKCLNLFHPDCLRTVFFGLFYLTWMFKVFRSLVLNLPMNLKCGKTWACQLPSMKHLNVVYFPRVFQTRCWDIVSLSVWLRPPLGYWDFYVETSSVLFTLPTPLTSSLCFQYMGALQGCFLY